MGGQSRNRSSKRVEFRGSRFRDSSPELGLGSQVLVSESTMLTRNAEFKTRNSKLETRKAKLGTRNSKLISPADSSTPIQDMRIYHGRSRIFVPKQLLNGADVVSILEQGV